MKKKFRLEDYTSDKYTMHCNTEEKAIIFCKFLDSIGKKWCNDESYLQINEWSVYEEGMCYCFNTGGYGNFNWCVSNNYTILEFDDFDWGNDIKLEVTTDYKDPKWCEVRNFEGDEWEKAILISDNSTLNLKFPYRVIYPSDEKAFLNGEADCVTARRRFARPLLEKKYKAYTEPKLDWVEREVKAKKANIIYKIRYVGKTGVIFSGDGGAETSFDSLYKYYTWLDDSVCGDEIK